MPLHKCKGKDCSFATDDLDAYIEHMVEHKIGKKAAEEETPQAPKRRHETVNEFLTCPECRPRFDKHYLEEGWTPPTKESEKKPEKGGLGI